MRPDRTFRRNFLIVAALHVVAVAMIYVFGLWPSKSTTPQVLWLDGGSIGGGETGLREAVATVEAEPPKPEPPPEPAPQLIQPEPPRPQPQAPSELVTPKATPEPTTPKPSTPKPETPKPTTPKPTTPKPTPKATPKASPKPATPKATPTSDGDATPKPKASPSDKPKGTPGAAKSPSASPGDKTAGTPGGNGAGTGNGKGPGKAGGGSGTSEFGWYFAMIHDRFHTRWEQPTSIVRSVQEFTTTLKLRIGKDGTILNREIVHSSGNTVMDDSVMAAAEKVQQIDPLPAGLGTGDVFEINIAFKLDQGQ